MIPNGFTTSVRAIKDNLPNSLLIVGPAKIPGMIQMMKCGFRGGASTAKLKKASRSDDIEP